MNPSLHSDDYAFLFGVYIPRPTHISVELWREFWNKTPPSADDDTPVSFRRIVIIESPWHNNDPTLFTQNRVYLRRCLRDSWNRGEIPFASHGFFPQFLNEETERSPGIEAGYRFWPLATKIIFYMDYNMSPGMQAAYRRADYDSRLLSRLIGRNDETHEETLP